LEVEAQGRKGRGNDGEATAVTLKFSNAEKDHRGGGFIHLYWRRQGQWRIMNPVVSRTTLNGIDSGGRWLCRG
jgi:hypothetical protein